MHPTRATLQRVSQGGNLVQDAVESVNEWLHDSKVLLDGKKIIGAVNSQIVVI
jgi:hypothetical protein